jgi:hypothetical protein
MYGRGALHPRGDFHFHRRPGFGAELLRYATAALPSGASRYGPVTHRPERLTQECGVGLLSEVRGEVERVVVLERALPNAPAFAEGSIRSRRS